MGTEELAAAYRLRYTEVLLPLQTALQRYFEEMLSGVPRIDHVAVRAKSIDRFLEKAQKVEGGRPKYSDPIHDIQDQVGARITTFYLSDVPNVKTLVERYFPAIESHREEPDSAEEFGYESHHYILFIPDDVIEVGWDQEKVPKFFELQLKTLFQHAWSQANHDLAYKAAEELLREQRRLVAFTAAQAWGADQIFDRLARELTVEN